MKNRVIYKKLISILLSVLCLVLLMPGFIMADEYQEEDLIFEEYDSEMPETEPVEILEEEILDSSEEYIDAMMAGTLYIGSTGADVSRIQQVLIDQQYMDYDYPTGYYGSITEQAVMNYQQANGLSVTGVADEALQNMILNGSSSSSSDAAPASSGSSVNSTLEADLMYGSYGSAVTDVQKMLNALGYYYGDLDGAFGPMTENSVIAYQYDYGLYVDGVVGPITYASLLSVSGFSSGTAKSGQSSSEESNIQISDDGLGQGDSGSEVLKMQSALDNLGFMTSGCDGDYGSMTAFSVKLFQLFNGISVTGYADSGSLSTLYSSPASYHDLYLGSGGTAVYGIQSILNNLGYNCGPVDGDFGYMTDSAVASFQNNNGLYADGVVGKVTFRSLLENVQYRVSGSSSSSSDSSQQAVSAEGLIYGGTYVISSGLGSGVLDIPDESTDAGTNVQLYADEGSTTQKWVLQDAGEGYYLIRNLMSWKVLDAAGGNVFQAEEDGTSTQKWQLVSNDSGYNIVNANGTYLTVAGGSTANGTNIDTESTSGSDAQIWNFGETSSGTELDFTQNSIQSIGIRNFSINQGNVTEITPYYNINTTIELPSGGYYLSGGENYSIGLKVMYVNSYLSDHGYLTSDYYNFNRYDSNTVWAVRQFQSDNGLEVDGIVGLYTWRAMGFSDDDFYNLGAYTTDLKVYAYGSSKDSYVTAMLNTAAEYAYSGTGYRDGASGEPGTWADCSGLIYQCLYAAGINPDTNIIDHARVIYEYTSAYLADDSRLGVAVSSAQPGDLIFYGGSTVNHVAIYAGDGMIYDSWPGLGVTYRGMYSPGNILKIVRVF